MTDEQIRAVLAAHRSLMIRARIDRLDADFALLLVLIGDRTMAVTELVGDAYFGTNVGYALNKLEARGLVARKPSPYDRRVSLVRRTPAGTAIASQLRALLRQQGKEAA